MGIEGASDNAEVTVGPAGLAGVGRAGNIPLLKILTQGPADKSKEICKMTKGPRKVKLVIVVNNKKE